MRYVTAALLSLLMLSPLCAHWEKRKLSLRKKERFPETVILYLPKEEGMKWKRVHQSAHPDNSYAVCEYIPDDQILRDWKQMINITFSSDTAHTIPELLEMTKSQVFDAHRHSYVTWTLHKTEDNEAVYEWSIPWGHYQIPAQTHLVRLIKSEQGIHTLVYTEKSPKIDQETRQDWMDYFSLGKIE